MFFPVSDAASVAGQWLAAGVLTMADVFGMPLAVLAVSVISVIYTTANVGHGVLWLSRGHVAKRGTQRNDVRWLRARRSSSWRERRRRGFGTSDGFPGHGWLGPGRGRLIAMGACHRR